MTNRLMRTCPNCKGTGVVETTGEYRATWIELKKHAEISGVGLAKSMNIKPTAMNNRLAVLERLGFAKSRRDGRLRLYTAVISE